MKHIYFLLSFTLLVNFGHAQVGIGTTTPGTALDVVGAITNRETSVAVNSNTATIPVNTSLVQLTGTATGNIVITAPAAPNAGQRLIIYNNTLGGFGSILNSITVPSGMAGEFVYSNGGWRSLSPIALAQPAIIPYASSLPVTLNTLITGAANTGAMVGFGNSLSGVVLTASNIDITGGSGLNINFGFTAPRAGTIKSISGFFSIAAGVNLLGASVTTKVQLYKSTNISSNIFSPVAGTEVILGSPYTGLLSVGDTRTGILTGLNISVTAQDRFLLVFSTTSNSFVTTINGYASAGLTIE